MKNIIFTIMLFVCGITAAKAQDFSTNGTDNSINKYSESTLSPYLSNAYWGLKNPAYYYNPLDTVWIVGPRLGIGTSAPLTSLHAKGNGSIFTLEGTTHAFMQFYPDGISAGRKAWIGFGSNPSQDLTLTNQDPQGKIIFKTNGGTRAVITETGNFGIKDANPLRPLSVTGTIRSSYTPNEAEFLEIGHGGGNAYLNWNGDGRLDYRYNLDHKMSLTQRGWLGILTESPTAQLHINTSALLDDEAALRIGGKGDVQVDASGIIGGRMMIRENGNIGIGIVEPEEKLHINGRARLSSLANGSGIWHTSNNVTDWFVGLNPNDDFRIFRDADRFFVGKNGLVGIGTNVPEEKLHVAGRMRLSSNINGTGMWFGSKTAGDWFIGLTGNDDLRIHNGSTRATMKPNGAFGLGTAEPQTRLHVNGIIRAGMSNHVELGHGGTHAFIRNGGAGDIDFRIGSERVMKITSTGKFLVGNVTAPGNYSIYAENGILTNEVKVALQSSSDWSDDAFDRVPSLEEMAQSINENAHLLGMPSAETLVKEGYSVTDMDSKLLEQIEWQAVHIIKMDKENKELRSEIDELSQQLKEIQAILVKMNEK